MGQGFDMEYHPNQQLVDMYQKRFEQYKVIGGFMEAQVIEPAALSLTTA
jgi:L-ribulokinase